MSVTHYPCIVRPCSNFVPTPDTLCAVHSFVLPEEKTAAIAIKKDAGKPPIHLVPRELIEGAARAYAFGAAKYDAWNYRKPPGLAVTRLMDSCLRHALAWLDGEENDPESGLCHLDHFGASVGMLMDTVKRIRAGALPAETDDRWKEKGT